MTTAVDRKIRSLTRYVHARVTFQQVVASCEFLLNHDSDEHAPFYSPFFTGICVSYMRPFMSADGLGPLPDSFSVFDNQLLARVHNDLKDGRNYAYAHHSPTQAATLLSDGHERIEQTKVRFIFAEDGSVTFTPPEVTWPKARLPRIIELCTLQLQRVDAEVHKLIAHLSEGKTYKHGIYTLGETFP